MNFDDLKNLWASIGEEGRTIVGIGAVAVVTLLVVAIFA